jgi:hypothetical protein
MKRYLEPQSKEKTKYEKEIFWTVTDEPPTWKDIKHLDLQDDDIIAMYEDADENGNENGYIISVVRWVKETDQEFQKRLQDIEDSKKRVLKMQYDTYLKLKEKFENEQPG